MNTIGQNQGVQPTGPQTKVPDLTTKASPVDSRAVPPAVEASVKDHQATSAVKTPSPQPPEPQQYLDPEKMREFVAKVSEAIRKASVEPHLVGFRPNPEDKGYLIEIRRPDGTLITSFQPEKVLNLHGNMDDLSGMVIDRKT